MSVSQVSFITTYKCPLECKFCGTSCNPRESQYLSYDFMASVVDEVDSWGYLELVVFTGGEPLLLGDELEKIIAHCHNKGLVTRIVTSAFWANSYDNALSVLERLKEIGLTEINYSIDDFHQEFVPIEYIGHAMQAAEAVNMPYLLAHKQLRSSKLTVEYIEAKLNRKLTIFRKGANQQGNNLISPGITVPIGRSSRVIPEDEWYLPELVGPTPWYGQCSSVMESIVITPNREVAICCGITRRNLPELTIGSLDQESLLSIIDRGNNDLITNWLALEGPESILRFVSSKDPSINLPEKYANTCHLCDTLFSRKDVREVLAKFGHEKKIDLLLGRGLLEHARSNPNGCCS